MQLTCLVKMSITVHYKEASEKHISTHWCKASNESIDRSQVTPGCVGKGSHSSFIQLFQLCDCIQRSHYGKQSICI
ncbi:hypothetical protein EYF80_005414 [Liparis tanakae]|uniref:Uncharacterized protein n=1 Tax=Liparis tanakae TaxID=230148 RepID=A0A4Z2J3A9_9TELE|nr:hypothetical protein EYF80_005414 [Liparis tanakae]